MRIFDFTYIVFGTSLLFFIFIFIRMDKKTVYESDSDNGMINYFKYVTNDTLFYPFDFPTRVEKKKKILRIPCDNTRLPISKNLHFINLGGKSIMSVQNEYKV